MDLLEAIRTRRSIRTFTEEPVDMETLRYICEAGTLAPSGLNNQPWRFVIITSEQTRRQLASLTKYRRILERARAAIAVFIDREAMYNETKDHQSIGACLQNMLLATHALGLGAVWLGEILNNAAAVRELLELPENLELMAVLAMGHPSGPQPACVRRPLDEVIIKTL